MSSEVAARPLTLSEAQVTALGLIYGAKLRQDQIAGRMKVSAVKLRRLVAEAMQEVARYVENPPMT